jgi:hypothetical protein
LKKIKRNYPCVSLLANNLGKCIVKEHLEPIFQAKNIDEVCAALQAALDALRAKNYLAKLPDYYDAIAARGPGEVQEWFNEMRNDDQAKEEGNLKEILGLFHVALGQLRELGFSRTD